MCGIVGLFSPSSIENNELNRVHNALNKMKHRGPNNQSVYHSQNCVLGHARLSIIDTSEKANQPMISDDGNFVLIFNGEIFNFQEFKISLEKKGVVFKTNSDTEVLLHLLINYGIEILSSLNGFFAFAFYNKKEHQIILARDRYGEKPLKYFHNENGLFFASDLNALSQLIPYRKLDYDALNLYFQFNYIPAPFTIYQDVKKLLPGEYLTFSKGNLVTRNYYQLKTKEYFDTPTAKIKLEETLSSAVKSRLISDVPLGCFLSGGIDSTIISGIAKNYQRDIHTFSIGFPNEKHYDETPFALEASKHLGTKHEVFNVSGSKLIENFDDVISKMDEPFADSSSLAVYELCKQTKSKITVALSGDGADELFGGYHKHLAHQKSAQKSFRNTLIKNSRGILKNLKGSRDSKIGNKIRQLNKYSDALALSETEKYIRWASQMSNEDVELLLKNKLSKNSSQKLDMYFNTLTSKNDLNNILIADLKLVLANDMLVKVDLMSMANSLEVRPPFLDFKVVELALSISGKDKIKGNSKKDVLKDTFKKYIPNKLIHRAKKGFEVPLISWFNNEMKKDIEKNWLNIEKIKSQSIFNYEFTENLKKTIFSSSPGNSGATVWAMIVFQEWLSKNEIEL